MQNLESTGLSVVCLRNIRKILSLTCLILWKKKLENPSCDTTYSNKDWNWEEICNIKKNEKWDQRKKGFNPSPFRKETRRYTDNNYNRPSSTNNNGVNGIGSSSGGWNNNSREIKCWGCNGPHLYINFPHNPNKKMTPTSMLQEASNANDLARNIARTNAALEYR